MRSRFTASVGTRDLVYCIESVEIKHRLTRDKITASAADKRNSLANLDAFLEKHGLITNSDSVIEDVQNGVTYELKPIANFPVKANIALYSNFVYNIYVELSYRM